MPPPFLQGFIRYLLLGLAWTLSDIIQGLLPSLLYFLPQHSLSANIILEANSETLHLHKTILCIAYIPFLRIVCISHEDESTERAEFSACFVLCASPAPRREPRTQEVFNSHSLSKRTHANLHFLRIELTNQPV